MSYMSNGSPANDFSQEVIQQKEVNEEQGISIKEVLQMMMRRKIGIALIVLVSLLISMMRFYAQTPAYYANAIMVSTEQGPGLGIMGGGSNSYYQSYLSSARDVELIKSLPFSETVVRELWKSAKRDSLELFGHRPYVSSMRKMFGWIKPVKAVIAKDSLVAENSLGFNSLMRQYAAVLNGRIRVSPSRDTNVFTVAVASPFPDESVFLTDMLCDYYQKSDVQRNTEKNIKSNRFVNEMLKEQRKLLSKADDALSRFMVANKMYSPSGFSSTWLAQVEGLDTRYNNNMIEYRIAKNKRDYLNNQLSAADREVSKKISHNVNAQLGSILEEIKDKEAEYLSLLREKPADDPEVKAKMRALDQVKSRYEQLSRSKIAGQINYIGQARKYRYDLIADKLQLEQKLNLLEYSSAEYKRAQKEYESRLTQFPEKEQEFIRLQRDREVVSKTYMFLKEKLDATRILIGSEVGSVTRVGKAFKPFGPESPQMNKYLLTGLVAGLVLAGVYTLGVEQLDDRINEDLSFFKNLGLSIWGTIPLLTAFDKASPSGIVARLHYLFQTYANGFFRRNRYPESETAQDALKSSTAYPIMTDMLSSAFAESFRSLRTNLNFARIDQTARTLLISGCSMGEGKSTVAANLAMAWAIADKKTLVIDADLRRPAQHNVFKKQRTLGLTDCLASNEEEVDDRYIQATHLDNLFLISAGSPVPNPNELLASEKMKVLLQKLSERYERIIIDSPPVFISDSAQLVGVVDAVLITARLGYSSKTILKQYAYDNYLHSHIIGVALIEKEYSMFNPFSPKYGHYGYHRYGYGSYTQAYPEKH